MALRRGLCSDSMGKMKKPTVPEEQDSDNSYLQKLWLQWQFKWMGGRMRNELGTVTMNVRRKWEIVKTRGRKGEQ